MTPKPPDPAQTAAAQQDINQQTAQQQFQLGATDQVTPGGSLKYEQIGTWPDGTPRYQATQQLSQQNQGLYDSLIGAAGTAAGNISNPINTPQLQTQIDTSNLSALPTNGDYSADRQRVEDALYSRLNPQLEAGRTSRETDLFNRGVRPGTAAYDRAMGLVGQQENDARTAVLLAGGQEQSRMFGDALAGRQQGYSEAANNATFGNNAKTGMFGMDLAARSQPINEISSLMSGSQVNSPNYVSTPQPGVAGVDYAGLVNNNYNQTLQRRQNIMSGLFGLGSSIAGIFSDERLKENIERVGETDGGTPIYTYNYKAGGPTMMGVMAQEAPKEAVNKHPSGYLMVDYGKVA